jgi:tight adherence protein B
MNAGLAPILIALLFASCFGLLAYAIGQAVREAMQTYSGTYAQDLSRQYEDLFLFIPARRIVHLARLAAVAVFLLLFFSFGDVGSSSGAFSGALFGGAGAVAALFAPRIALRVLRERRARRFNLQLVDALINMSGALRAGFSILQAFETVVKQGQNPIAQEFGLFLQQIRVGVRFDEALRHMEERVGSDDLILMNQSIEVARLTGGNLTEVFEKIAATIRERMRIEQRIRSLTSQQRLQALVVGAMPVLLMFAMTLIDPKMMMPFFASRAGVMLLALVAMLEVLGALLIRKIMAIRV